MSRLILKQDVLQCDPENEQQITVTSWWVPIASKITGVSIVYSTVFFSGADQSKLESSTDNVSIWWRLMMPYKNCDGYLDIRYGPNLFLCRCVPVGNSPTRSPHPFISISCSRFMHTANAICKLINPVRTPNIQWAQQWYEMFWSFLNYIESTMVGWVVSNEQLLSLYIHRHNPSHVPANSRELRTVTGWPLNDC